jgi:hypothetical protein
VTTAELTERREHAATVAAMLDELAQLRQRIYVSKAFGARAAGLRDLKADFRSAQRRLVAVASS